MVAAPPGQLYVPPNPILLGRATRTKFSLYFGGSGLGAASANPAVHIWGGGLDVGASFLIGFNPRFPGLEGGNWHALAIRPIVGLYGAGVVYSDGAGAGSFMIMGTANIGYELLHFFPAGPDVDQNGIGFFIGPRVGVQYTDVIGNTQSDEADPTVGATASLVLPQFKPNSGRLSAGLFNLAVWVLPGTSLTFFSAGGAGEF